MPFFMRHAVLGLPNRAMPMHATDDRHVMSLVCFTLQSEFSRWESLCECA